MNDDEDEPHCRPRRHTKLVSLSEEDRIKHRQEQIKQSQRAKRARKEKRTYTNLFGLSQEDRKEHRRQQQSKSKNRLKEEREKQAAEMEEEKKQEGSPDKEHLQTPADRLAMTADDADFLLLTSGLNDLYEREDRDLEAFLEKENERTNKQILEASKSRCEFYRSVKKENQASRENRIVQEWRAHTTAKKQSAASNTETKRRRADLEQLRQMPLADQLGTNVDSPTAGGETRPADRDATPPNDTEKKLVCVMETPEKPIVKSVSRSVLSLLSFSFTDMLGLFVTAGYEKDSCSCLLKSVALVSLVGRIVWQ